jgi:hypothetical protein
MGRELVYAESVASDRIDMSVWIAATEGCGLGGPPNDGASFARPVGGGRGATRRERRGWDRCAGNGRERPWREESFQLLLVCLHQRDYSLPP